MADGQERIRFTPEELKELIQDGSIQFRHEDLRKLAPADMRVAEKIFQDMGVRPEPIALEPPILFGPGAAGATAAGLGELATGAAKVAGKVVPPALKAGAYAVGAKMGHPFAIGALGGWLANGAKKILGGVGEEEAIASQVGRKMKGSPLGPPAEFTGSKVQGAMQGQTIPTAPRGGSIEVPSKPAIPGPTGSGVPAPSENPFAANPFAKQRPGAPPTAPTFQSPRPSPTSNVTKGSGDIADIMERALNGGVQNNFRGRVSIQPKSAYPSGNIGTESSYDDLLEMILRETSMGQPSPLMFHPSAPQGMRSSVDKLKRTVARRKPK